MIGAHPNAYDFSWNRPNLVGLMVICLVSASLLTYRGFSSRVKLGQRIAVDPQRVSAASELIDPNKATPASLRRLPGIGPKIANGILEYRRQHPDRPFRRPDDLANVRNIGKVKVNAIRKYLEFRNGQ